MPSDPNQTLAAFFRRWRDLARERATTADLLVWAVILATAALLRLWGLGVQSQWYDEMLVTVHAANSLAYLTDLSWRVEIHPPLYYWLNHLLQAVWADDGFLHLPSALAGIAGIPLIGLVAARLGSVPGLPPRLMAATAMALASVNPLHIWISRQVRPYSIILLFCCAGFLLLFKLLEKPTRKAVLWLVAVNLPIVALHYVGLVVMACQGLCLAVARLTRLGVTPVRDMALFAAGSVVTALPFLAFLASVKWLHTRSYAGAFLHAAGDLDVTTSKLFFQLRQFLDFGYFDGSWLWLLPLAACAFGLACLWRANPGRALACLVLIAAFPLLLVAIRYTGHFTPVHLCYALPLLYSCLGAAYLRLLPGKWRNNLAVLVLLAVLGGVFVVRDGRAFYHPDAAVADAWHGSQERYKRIARLLAANTDSRSFVILDDNFAAGAVDWYMRAGSPPKSLDDYAVAPDQERVDLLFLSKMLENVTPAPSFAFVRDAPLPSPVAGPTGKMGLYMALVPRVGQLDWSPRAPLATTAGMLPHTLLRHVRSLRHMRIFAGEDRFWMCPSRTGIEGEAVWRFVSAEPFAAGTVYLILDAAVQRPGNRLVAEARFDDGEFRQVARLGQGDAAGPIFLRIRSDAPFLTLEVRLVSYVSGDKADRIDGPLEQVRLGGVTAFVPPDDNRFHSRNLDVAEQGLEAPMPDDAGGLTRWGRDVSTLTFDLDRPGPVRLGYAVDSPLPGQRGTVSVGGVKVAVLDLGQGPLAGEVTIPGAAGKNVVTLAWDLANTGTHVFAPTDARPLAVRYRRLALDAVP